MSNTFITPTVIAKTALAVLYNNAVLAGLVWRDFDSDFTGKQGASVTIKTPAQLTASDFVRGTGIQTQNVTEGSTTATLDTIADVSVVVTSEDLTLSLESFQEQIAGPAMEAIVQKIDGELAEALIDAAETSGGGGTATWSSSSPRTVFTGETGAVAKLGRNKAPSSERYAVFSPEGEGVMLSDELFLTADKSGSTDGLRNASIGRALGFESFSSQVLGYGSGDKAAADGVAFHRHAVALVSRTLELPDGVAAGQAAAEGYKGLGIRVVKDYDITYKQDVVSFDFLYGIETLRKQFAVQLSFGLGS